MGSLCPQCGHRFAVIDIGSQQLGHCCMTISRKGRGQTALRRKRNLVSSTRQPSQSQATLPVFSGNTNTQGATEDQSAAFSVDAVKNDASPRARAVGERLTPYSAPLIASRATEAIAGEVVVIVAIIVPFIAGRASVPA